LGLSVRSGWVLIANSLGETLVPAGAASDMRVDRRPGVPVFIDAPTVYSDRGPRVRNRRGRRPPPTSTPLSRPRAPATCSRCSSWCSEAPPAATDSRLVPRCWRRRPAGVSLADVVRGEAYAMDRWRQSLPLPPPKGWLRNWRDGLPTGSCRARVNTLAPERVCFNMNRRNFLTTLTLVSTTFVGGPANRIRRSGLEYLPGAGARATRSATHAFRQRTHRPANEPGTPFVIHGRVFRADGVTPAPDIIVFAYHTDAAGHYDVPSAAAHSWRLRGWVRTDANGHFEFTTIRPAPYPNRKSAAHVHFSNRGPGVPRQSWGLMFEGDPLLTRPKRDESARAGHSGMVRPVEKRDGVQHVTSTSGSADDTATPARRWPSHCSR
jgi:protocatechuate 3,4-dioxygenase beta subunit